MVFYWSGAYSVCHPPLNTDTTLSGMISALVVDCLMRQLIKALAARAIIVFSHNIQVLSTKEENTMLSTQLYLHGLWA